MGNTIKIPALSLSRTVNIAAKILHAIGDANAIVQTIASVDVILMPQLLSKNAAQLMPTYPSQVSCQCTLRYQRTSPLGGACAQHAHMAEQKQGL